MKKNRHLYRGRKLSRRTILRGAGGAAVSLPFLEAMLGPGRTMAQGGVPKRVVFFFTSCGVVPDQWWPSGGETDFTFGNSLLPLEPYRSKIIIPDGIEMTTAKERRGDGGNGHDVGTGHCLTAQSVLEGPMGVGMFGHLYDGSAGGISIDQHIGNHVKDTLGDDIRYGSLEFGVKAEGISQNLPSRISYRSPFNPVIPMHTPGQAFDRVFAEVPGDSGAAERRERQRRLVLSNVSDDLNQLHAQLGRDDRARLDSHLTSIEEITNRLGTGGGIVCDQPEREESTDYETMGRLQLDLMVQSLKCDLTRVASIQWRNGQSGQRHSWLGHSDGHHSLSHEGISNTTAKTQSAEIDRWQCEQFAYLLAGLEAAEIGDGTTLLDHTAVVWVNEQEQSIGNIHRWNRMPFIIAGGAGGYFRTGRKVELSSRPHADLFVNLMHAMGMEDNSFGIPEFCNGPIEELT